MSKAMKDLSVQTMYEIISNLNEGKLTLEEVSVSRGVVEFLQYAFDPALKFHLPEGVPPFNKCPNPMGMTPANLRREVRTLYVFARPANDELQKLKRERSFIELLEAVHPLEAELLLAVKDQTLDTMFPNVTLKRLVEAGLLKVELDEGAKEEDPAPLEPEPTPEPVTENQDSNSGEKPTEEPTPEKEETESNPAPKRGRKVKPQS